MEDEIKLEKGRCLITTDGLVKMPVGEIKPVDTGFGIKDRSLFDLMRDELAGFSNLSAMRAGLILDAIDNADDAELDKLLSKPIEGLLPVEVSDDSTDGIAWNIEREDALLLVHRDLFKCLVKYARMTDEQKQMFAVSRAEYRKKEIYQAEKDRENGRNGGIASAQRPEKLEAKAVLDAQMKVFEQMIIEWHKKKAAGGRTYKNKKALIAAFKSREFNNKSGEATLYKKITEVEKSFKLKNPLMTNI